MFSLCNKQSTQNLSRQVGSDSWLCLHGMVWMSDCDDFLLLWRLKWPTVDVRAKPRNIVFSWLFVRQSEFLRLTNQPMVVTWRALQWSSRLRAAVLRRLGTSQWAKRTGAGLP